MFKSVFVEFQYIRTIVFININAVEIRVILMELTYKCVSVL